ncbi:hypothetical protein ACLMJK_007732 [Lecanora helva]
MSALLWKYFFENDVDNFRQVLARATHNAHTQYTKAGATMGNSGFTGSPGAALATSPTLTSKSPKQSSWTNPKPLGRDAASKSASPITLSRADVNWKDPHRVTLLHHIASSTNEKASEFALALLELPTLDIYVQDEESGWTALHRALYFGNITIARALMRRDIQDALEHSSAASAHGAGGLIKIKDREGNSPFDVYAASITSRNIRYDQDVPLLDCDQDEEDVELAHGSSGDASDEDSSRQLVAPTVQAQGDEVFAFGSNKNFTLGLGDEDDRQFPERIHLERPVHLIKRFYNEHQRKNTQDRGSPSPTGPTLPTSRNQMPAAVQYRPIIIQDVQLSKLHSAVLTTDPEANLFMCGFGSGGRLGMGDETTRFSFVNVHGGGLIGKKVIHVGLGQNHTVAISSEGETFAWGSNAYGQLGFATGAQGVKDNEPLQLLPRQIFGPLKREVVVGAAASRIHSVVHTTTSLFTFGKNEGQLGLTDSDARSLSVQSVPRKVAASLFSCPIHSVSAIEKATVCLLENSEVWVFANYGYTKISFPSEIFSNYFLKSIWGPRSSSSGIQICKITSGGDTICALSNMGDVFTVHVTQKVESSEATASTTNPSKIRGALSTPQRVWSLKKGHMAVRDVDVSQDGSIIICTKSGSVWRRVRRTKIKDASAAGLTEYKAKDYKFSRVPGLTNIAAVRSNIFGAYAAIRRDSDILKSQIDAESKKIWKDMYRLLPFHGLADEDSDTENPMPRFWRSRQNDDVAAIRRAVLTSNDFEQDVADYLVETATSNQAKYDARVGSTLSEVYIPVHSFVLGARSEIFRRALESFCNEYFFSIPEMVTIEYDAKGQTLILFQGVDFLTLFNFILYLYTDSVADVWHHTKQAPSMAFRYRQIRTELMKIATQFHMQKLEQAVRTMQEPPKTLDRDFASAIRQPGFFDNGDVEIELDGGSVKVHSSMMIQRCPFFEGLFEGRSSGFWLTSRRNEMSEYQDAVKVDLKHINPTIFHYVLQHLYADTGEEMFEDVISPDLDSYLDLVLEVLSVANELMLDRLAQCCQKTFGRYVNIRNVCQLLNAVAPCSVTQFKDAALEYICLNLEGLLENRLLDELDDDLMLELDEVVRQNQRTCLPIAKSGRADSELIERYPRLLDLIERSKRIRIDSIALQTRLREREAKHTGGLKTRIALEDFESYSSPQDAKSAPSRARTGKSKSPALKPKTSMVDLMFEMDEDDESDGDRPNKSTPTRKRRPTAGLAKSPRSSALDVDAAFEDHQESEHSTSFKALGEESSPSQYHSQAVAASPGTASTTTPRPWGLLPLSATKFDMKDIMAQDSSSRGQAKSSDPAKRHKDEVVSSPSHPMKMSQRERKIQQQQQQSLPRKAPDPQDSPSIATHKEDQNPASPWQIASRGPKVSLKDVLGSEPAAPPPSTEKLARTPSPMTLRQTVAGKAPAARRSVTDPSASTLPIQKRSVSTPSISKLPSHSPKTPPNPVNPSRSSSSSTTQQLPTPTPPAARSIRYTNPETSEPTLQLSMADILSQQQTEKEVIKEAAAKRSLQEIQEEQAFQEWWDEESRKVREEAEGATNKSSSNRGKRGANGSRGRGKGRERGAISAGDARGNKRSEGSSSGRGGGRGAKKGANSGSREEQS